MAEIWKEVYKPRRKGELPPIATPNQMWEFPVPSRLPHTLSPSEAWFVRVCAFTFVFYTREQIEACLDYYSRKTHPTGRIPSDRLGAYGGDSWERQRWFERLPMFLLEEPKRKKVVVALTTALMRWSDEHR